MELLPWSGIHEIVDSDGSFMGEEIYSPRLFCVCICGDGIPEHVDGENKSVVGECGACVREKDRHEEKSGASSGLFVIENGTHAPIPLLRVLRNALDGRRLAECHLLAQTCVLAVLPRKTADGERR